MLTFQSVPPRARQLITDLDAGNYAKLLLYAGSRIRQLGLVVDPADLVHDAIESVLIGLKGTSAGRHPRPADVRDSRSFLNYLKLVIKSIATAAGRHQRCLTFVGIDVLDETVAERRHGHRELTAASCPYENPEFRDLHRILFQNLRRRAPDRLRRIVKTWSTDFFWSDTIQLEGAHRQYRSELRCLMRQLLNEIEPTLWPSCRSGARGTPCFAKRDTSNCV